MRKLLWLALVPMAIVPAQAEELVLPAGSLLSGILDEPNFSSSTAQVGDPLVCAVHGVRIFGESAFPKGAYLSGSLEEYQNPGWFFGKGWIKLEFDRLILPDREVPLSAKVISAGRLKVDAEGKIHGRGHPRRDAFGWSIPLLWPVKIITLPLRGPRPALKGEVRLTLRMLDDVTLPAPDTHSSRNRTHQSLRWPTSSNRTEPLSRKLTYAGTSRPALQPVEPVVNSLVGLRPEPEGTSSSSGSTTSAHTPAQLTVLILRDQPGYLMTDYWIESDEFVSFLWMHGPIPFRWRQ